MRTVTITCQIQFDVHGTATTEKILSAVDTINEKLSSLNLYSEPQILVQHQTDFLINSIVENNKA